MGDTISTRRRFLVGGAALATAAACGRSSGNAPQDAARPTTLPLGRRSYGERSRFETAARTFNPQTATPGTGASRTPLQDCDGIITPSSLHFERHHAGVPEIDPSTHELLVHGLVRRPLVLKVADLKRLPSVSRLHFLECAGNSGREHAGRPGTNPQQSHGLASCSVWTGVPLRTVLEAAGLDTKARWVVAEGADACRLGRSIPLDKALDDTLVAYGQNGEALRPEQGYPVRLIVPGWEGNVNIKWLGRLHVLDQPAMTRAEAVYYTDLLPDGKARHFTFVMEAKSVITRPAGGGSLSGPGPYDIVGLAWSGRGRVRTVEISTDGGASWAAAQLDEPILPKAFTRFHFAWRWDGGEATLQSRCTDETEYTQPTRELLVSARGMKATDHYNGIKAWHVHRDGSVTHA